MKNVDRTSGANNRRLFITVVILIIFIIVGGYFFYTGQENSLRQQKETELKTIAEFKIRHISSWYQSEVEDANTISTGSDLKRKMI